MSTHNHIPERHRRDRWKDVAFIGVAVLIAVLAIGSVTTKAQGRPPQWGVAVFEQPSILDPTVKNPTDRPATEAVTTETNE